MPFLVDGILRPPDHNNFAFLPPLRGIIRGRGGRRRGRHDPRAGELYLGNCLLGIVPHCLIFRVLGSSKLGSSSPADKSKPNRKETVKFG